MSPPPLARPARPRALLRRARGLRALAAAVTRHEKHLREAIGSSYAELRDRAADRELASIPVARLREVSEGRLRTGPLEDAGLSTVRDVAHHNRHDLQRIPGMGERSAELAVAAAAQVATAVRDTARVRIDYDPKDRLGTALLTPLHRIIEVDRAAPAARRYAGQITGDLGGLLSAAWPARSRIRMWFTSKRKRAAAREALARVGALVAWADANRAAEQLRSADRLMQRRPARRRKVWADFEKRSPEFYVALGEIVQHGTDVHAAEGFLSEDVLERVRAQPLDDRFRRVSLRGYQSFGARFALAQRRVIIGDEMGLGKTIQAIAALAHLRAGEERHFMVVCPASVLINWMREVETRSHLRVHRVHGPDREIAFKAWVAEGGVAVTTFDSLHDMKVPDGLPIGAFVVDEAHYVKNPQARRSKAVRAWTQRCARVIFLTGTPMENRVAEFRNLVHYLQPRVAPEISDADGVAGAVAFRKAVAPVYLRRNQEDVLLELPGLVRTDEWLEFGRPDFRLYRDAVASGNFMAMRRAAYASSDPASSTKLARLLELVDEAAANGRKVVVFSFFREVLDIVKAALEQATTEQAAQVQEAKPTTAKTRWGRSSGQEPRVSVPVFGPLTGSVPALQRQALVDAFAAASGPAVLAGQIQAGGVGLNIQAASVVILCEPQIKPTVEEQAIARCHRMGQVRSVQVHRLLTTDSVDERMIEILSQKTKLFDEYARHSDLAKSSPDALDLSDAALGRQVVAMERTRLSLP